MNKKNFNILLKEVDELIDNPDSMTVNYVFEILMNNGASYEAIVPAYDIENFAWVVKATNGLARFEQKKGIASEFYQLVHDCIDMYSDTVGKKYIFPTNGWKLFENQWIYVTGDGCIGAERTDVFSSSDYHLDTNFGVSNSVLDYQEIIDKFLQMQNIYRDSKLSHWLQVFVCASVCGTLFESVGAPLRSVTAMVGTTNTKKTSVARVFSQFLNVEKGRNVPVTFASTKGGIETFVSDFNDAILLVDDFMPVESTSEWNEQKSKLHFLIRAYGDGVAKERMASDSKTRRKRNSISGSCLITAELLPGTLSSKTRIVRLDIPNDGVNLDCLSYYQRNPFVLSNFIRIFIEYLARNMTKVLEYMSSHIQSYRAQAGFRTSRYNEVYAQMMIVLDVLCCMFNEHIGKVHPIPQANSISLENLILQATVTSPADLVMHIRDTWSSDIYNILLENDRETGEESFSRIIVDAMCYAIEKSGGTKSLNEIQEWKTSGVYEDEDYLYLTQALLYRDYCEYIRKMNTACCLSKTELVKKMKENGLLKVETDNRNCQVVSLKLCQKEGIHSRFLYVKKNVLNDLREG